ncbi:MAG TPA: ABC transporter substrate-binding protein [Candidatus Methylomirabilis sp.]
MRHGDVWKWLLVGMAAAAGLALGAGTAGAAETYRIGVTAAITGRAGDTYAPFYEGIKAYVQRINDRGGIQGRRIELVVEDDRGEPQRVAAHAKKFTGSDTVILMVNSTVSAAYKPMMAEAEAAKVPVLFAGGVCPRESLPPAQPLFFCATSFGAKIDSEFAVNFMRRQMPGKKFKAGFAGQDIPVSRAEIEYAEQYAKQAGIDTAPAVIIPGATADFTPFATRLKEGGIDWGFSWALWHIQIGPFEALRRLGWDGRWILIAHAQAQDELTRLKDEKLYAFTANAMFTENLPIHGEIREAAQKAGSKYPVTQMAEGYGSGMALEASLQKCGWPCDKDRLTRAMANLTVDMRGLRGGPIEWTEANHYRKVNLYKVYHWDKAQNRIVAVGDWARVEVK